MRRADRLFRIVQFLRLGRLLTAQSLAEKLQVSVRTVYRDVRDLQLSGMPIEGEAGVGYTLRRDFDLPPLMFTRSELIALVLGARLVRAWGGEENVTAATQALQRIEAAVPAELRDSFDSILLYAPEMQLKQSLRKRLDSLHAACVARQAIAFDYQREDGEQSHRTARPLALAFWSGVWTLAAWCELRKTFRAFRIDRMDEVVVLERVFIPKRGEMLEDFLKEVRSKAPSSPSSQT
ncbi:helix-turn-helix transcriptional regulator [Granulicella arctica]|uniref:Putative DNA-binding transcriptional regulator YafY n=1 Tax=Granulicella arctica TaxID=940613 RepID=A0A7Y9PF27_9BACT|nr:YafY family protein [Granulicella arctica]NYF78743.1 putative DNA-binding transcriptional regulator YafY [Granulicella arctica]